MNTAKQKIREVLEEIWAKPDWTSDDPNEMADYQDREIDQALDSIEEIVLKEVIGNQTIYEMAHEEGVSPEYVEGYNNMVFATKLMRAEQLLRWSGE